ncbi:four helix bundle protein [uncultured Aquimarina sp.]|uniref:four helix bundle protein n=1 Tax=uncultured Aquimarina sp. TaxID=575652 RepID=UPI002632481F|nr:four helix bundle protein [uncultured Aquimarina sp.]
MDSKYNFKFENLTVYNKAMEFGEIVNTSTKKFPKEERFELSSQFRRAADSIALNIAEGSGGTDPQFYNYLGNAWHSAHECVSCSSKARIRRYITLEEDEENRRILTELSKMITTLRNRISDRIKSKK